METNELETIRTRHSSLAAIHHMRLYPLAADLSMDGGAGGFVSGCSESS